jgi:hypothetical protein
MHEFLLLFRPTRPLTPDELPRRNAAARDWALALRSNGRLSDAYPLEERGFTVAERLVEPVTLDDAVASVLVIQADDLQGVVELVKGHPGLAFGTEIEVRPVNAVTVPELK